MGALLVAWAFLPVVLALLALGFGALVERAAGAPIPLGLRLATGFAAYVAWCSLGTVGPVGAEIVGAGAVLLGVAGLVLALRATGWRPAVPSRPERPALIGALSVLALVALPFVADGHAGFGGYGSLGDGGFQMVGAILVPDLGATTHGMEPSSLTRLMDQYFGDGYPAGSVLALGYPTRWLGAWPLHTFQPFQAVLLAVGALGAAALAAESGLVRGRWTGLVAFAAGAAPLTAAFALQGSVKEVGGAALSLVVAGTAAWAWAPLLAGRARAGIPTGLAVAACIGVVGPGIGPLLLAFGGLVALTLVVLVLRGGADRRVVRGVAVAVAVALVAAIPAVLAAVEVSSVAGSVLTAQQEFGNLGRRLDWWKPLAAWDSPDYRFVGEFGHRSLSTASALLVGLAVLGALGLAVRRRAWIFAAFVVASAVACWYLVAIGSPWAGGKAMAIAAMAFWAAAATLAAAAGSHGRPRLGGAGAAVLVGLLLLTAAFAYRGARLSPPDRFDELRDLAAVVDDDEPVLITEFDEFTKVAFARDRPQVLGENAFLRWPLRTTDGAYTGAVLNPTEDALQPRDLAPFRWIAVRRGPASSWPPPSFELVRTTTHYWLFRRTTDRVPRVWRPVLAQDDAATTVSCRRIRALGRGAFALVRPGAVSLRLRNAPSFWVPREEGGYVFTLRGSGVADESVEIPADGRYRVWAEGSFNRRLGISVDGREVTAVERGRTNQLLGPELATGEDGLPLRAGTRTVRVSWPGGGIAPGSARSAGTLGRVWLQPAEQAPRLVTAGELPCRDGRVSVDWYGAW